MPTPNSLRLIHVQNALNNTCAVEKIPSQHYKNVSAHYGLTKQQTYAYQILYGQKSTQTITIPQYPRSVKPPKNKFK